MIIFDKDCPYKKSNVFSCLKFYLREIFICMPKRFWQRGTKGYCYEDLWGIDDWFMEIMPRMLAEFREKSYGYPSEFSNMGEEDGEAAWKEILTRMENLLTDMKKNPYNTLEEKEEFFKLFSKWFYNLWD